ncbi:MAG: undecaprenyl-diphosphate phosphatase [Actinobacteria bacterium]|nr:undecaprenyl-diphosphate phosphatase [Actinomycetota bacterium]NBY14767.1 undecaprenyl-diphosphate phosphatase [Actinomycetota bacterium]
MDWIQAIVLGVVQGLTEFLPVSSNAHVEIVSRLLHWGDPGAAFTAVTQIGTETAVIIYFWNDIKHIISAWFRSIFDREARKIPEARLGWYVILGSLPIGVLGLVFKNQIETTARNLWLVAVALIVMGIVLGLADKYAKHAKTMDDLNSTNALSFGIGQAMALIPGVSRSGATISFGLLMGFKRDVAARYSFLLAIPAVLASGSLQLASVISDPAVQWPVTLVATVVAFVVGYWVIATLMKYLVTGSFMPFVIYRIGLGLAIMAWLYFGNQPGMAPAG